jgi:uncharacterized protein
VVTDVAGKPRLISIDIMRGFSLLGVLLANLQSFTYPGVYLSPLAFGDHTALDRVVEAFIRTFTEGSFYPLFAALFGLGFAMQMQKPGFEPHHFRRRLVVLLGLGVLHATLIWEGDILVSYALLGFALVPMNKRSNCTLLFVVFGCLGYSLVMFYVASQAGGTPQRYLELITTTYAQGSYLEATQVRLIDLGAVLIEVVLYFPHILACFLLGLLVSRRGVAETLTDRRLLHRILALSLGIGLPIVVAHSIVMFTQPRVPAWLASLDTILVSAALGLAYAAALLLLVRAPAWQRRLRPLEAVGRTSLSSYLIQSLVFTSLYYGYGGGLYARVPLSMSALLALALYTLQVLVSRWWLSRYAQGPIETLWRRLAYATNTLPLREIGQK